MNRTTDNRTLDTAALGAASARRDDGTTIVEVLMAIVLVAIAVVPIMVASWTLVRTTNINRYSAKVETILGNAADRVNRAPSSCDYHIYYEAAALAQGWSTDRVSASYQWYEPSATFPDAGTWHAGACPDGLLTDGLVQRVDLTVASPDGRLQRSIQVVKSDI